MANTFITPTVIASRGIATLYNTIVLAGLVWRDFDADFRGKQGDTITVRKPAVFTAAKFDQTVRTTTWQDATEDSTTIVLNELAHVPFLVTDEQMTLKVEDFQNQLLAPAMEAIAQKIDGDLAEAMVDAAEGAGGGGTATKGSNNGDYPLRKSREILTRNKLPTGERYAVLSPETVTDLLGTPSLVEVDKAGATDALRQAIVGRLFGQETYESQVFGFGAGDRGQADGIAFHKSAQILATRPLQQPKGIPSDQFALTSYKGLSLRVIYSYNHAAKQDQVTVDILYGLKTARPEAVVQLSHGIGS